MQTMKDKRSRLLLIDSEVEEARDQRGGGAGSVKVVDDTWSDHVASPACRGCLFAGTSEFESRGWSLRGCI